MFVLLFSDGSDAADLHGQCPGHGEHVPYEQPLQGSYHSPGATDPGLRAARGLLPDHGGPHLPALKVRRVCALQDAGGHA